MLSYALKMQNTLDHIKTFQWLQDIANQHQKLTKKYI